MCHVASPILCISIREIIRIHPSYLSSRDHPNLWQDRDSDVTWFSHPLNLGPVILELSQRPLAVPRELQTRSIIISEIPSIQREQTWHEHDQSQPFRSSSKSAPFFLRPLPTPLNRIRTDWKVSWFRSVCFLSIRFIYGEFFSGEYDMLGIWAILTNWLLRHVSFS